MACYHFINTYYSGFNLHLSPDAGKGNNQLDIGRIRKYKYLIYGFSLISKCNDGSKNIPQG